MTSINIKEARYFRRHYQVEVLLNNLVDKDVQTMLLPLNWMQLVGFCPKYRIKDNFITPNSGLSNLVSLVGTCFLLILLSQRFLTIFDPRIPKPFFICNCVDSLLYFCGFWVNFFVGIKYSEHNVNFVLTIQDVHRFLNDGPKFRFITFWNWFIVISVSSLFVAYSIYFQIHFKLTSFNIGASVLIIFDFNIIYAIRLIQFLESKLILWNIEALKSQDLKGGDTELHNHNLFQAFVKICECYEIYKVTVGYLIGYFIAEGFVHALLYYGVLILSLGDQGPKKSSRFGLDLAAVSLYVWLVKGVLLLAILTQSCEKFYKAVESSQDTCAIILKSGCSGYKKRLCKNVQRLYRTSFSKISVMGLMQVDAVLMLEMTSTITNNVIVMLQFMFS